VIGPNRPASVIQNISLTLDHVLAADNGSPDGRSDYLTSSTGTINSIDPQLQALAYDDAGNYFIPILFGSPAWNTGDLAFIAPPSVDERGLPRVVEIVDIGAYEQQERTGVVVPAFTG